MNSVSIVRKIDNLGRIVVPKETRQFLQIETGDLVQIFIEGETIILKKYKITGTCPITGDISPSIALAGGQLKVSSEGAKQLLTELEQKLLN